MTYTLAELRDGTGFEPGARFEQVRDTRYNGWKNYETWSVALIVDNDEGLYLERRENVRAWAEEAEATDYWTLEEARRFHVADKLKGWVEEAAEEAITMTDLVPLSFLWSQLIGAALSEVDWDEIADHWLDDLAEEAS